ncbi:MAG: 50S ribosomal protein L18 [Acidobacteriia bacterium]|nr:50S ribosomal protein L18 [Terriglobia bacterium]
MNRQLNRIEIRKRIHGRIRERLQGTHQRPRLAVFRSLNHIYAQVIDDEAGRTLAAASSKDKELNGKLKSGGNVAAAKLVGELVAKRALEKGVQLVVFDRGGLIYHGRVKTLAEAARAAGLKF